jgi:hypothetical protein
MARLAHVPEADVSVMNLHEEPSPIRVSLRTVNDHGVTYTALMFVCPGCASTGSSGVHLLPVNSPHKQPSWEWDGNFEAPTLSPSILTRGANESICHSFLRGGVFEFLGDCTHTMAGTSVQLPPLPGGAR